MRIFFPVLILMILASPSRGQETGVSRSGNISFISPQNIYVKFKSTKDISIGDTLFITKGDSLVPSMIVRYLSTTSVACNPIGSFKLAQGMTVWFTQKQKKI
jgi:hypothetical protein